MSDVACGIWLLLDVVCRIWLGLRSLCRLLCDVIVDDDDNCIDELELELLKSRIVVEVVDEVAADMGDDVRSRIKSAPVCSDVWLSLVISR